MNRIEAVAIIFGTDVWLGIPGKDRHHHVIARHNRYCPLHPWGSGEQGFVDSRGQFWGRRHAYSIAANAGQLIDRPDRPASLELFSEDLWS